MREVVFVEYHMGGAFLGSVRSNECNHNVTTIDCGTGVKCFKVGLNLGANEYRN
jgi:hypothetical protein